MDTFALKLLIDVAANGNFASVARKHALDPSTVSRTIAGVEEQLQVRLFQRSTRRVTLTEAGELYVKQIQGIVEALNYAEETAKQAQHHVSGTLRITASIAFGQICLLPRLKPFQTQHPEVKLDIQLTDKVVDVFSEGTDVALRLMSGSQADSTHLIGHKLFDTRYFVCASPDYLQQHPPLEKPQDLAEHACLTMDLPYYQTRWLFQQKARLNEAPTAIHLQSNLSISSALGLKTCAIQGMGPALLADWLIKDALASGELVKLFTDYHVTATDFETAAWILYPSRHYVPAKTRAMVNFLQSSYTKREDI